MSFVISSLLPFPRISWWCHVLDAGKVCWDLGEHFEKMSYRNRYVISAANGPLKLSIPLHGGRDQRTAMKDILVSNEQDWQKQHWRTLVSAYNRSPYFEFYAPSLEQLFKTPVQTLVEFSSASTQWLKQQLRLRFEEEIILKYEKVYPDAQYDLRKKPPRIEHTAAHFPSYIQVFSEQADFLADLSLLDLFFAKGPHTLEWLRTNKDRILRGA